MAAVLTNICKYAMLAFILLYTMGAFSALGCRTSKSMRPCFWFMNIMSFFYLSCGFVIIALNEKSMLIVAFYAAIIAYNILYLVLYRVIYPKANLALLSHQILLMSMGMILLTRLKYTKAFRQFAVIAVSSVVTLVVPRMFARLRAARVWAAVAGAIGLLLLAAVFLLGKEEQSRFFMDYETYSVASELSADAELLAVIERAQKDEDFRERLLGIIKLMEK